VRTLAVAYSSGSEREMNDSPCDNQHPQKAKSKVPRRNKGMCLEDRPVLEPNAAGIDVGAREMFVAVPPDRDENPVGVSPHLPKISNA
jgi:hypothetical protein